MVAVFATRDESELAVFASSSPSPESRAPSPESRASGPELYNRTMRISLAALALLFASCSTSAQPIKPQTASDVVATVGATSITLAQVDEVAMQQPASSFGGLK